MKKINSINYGGRVISLGLVFIMIIPAALYALNRLFRSSIIEIIMFVALGIGIAVEVGFGCVLLLELRQDKIINKYYENNPYSLKTPQEILDDCTWFKIK